MAQLNLETPDKLEYQFHPLPTGVLNFKIRAANDAHIALTQGPSEGNPMFEVFIGGWGNTKSIIRKNKTKPEVAENNTPQILNGDEFRGFWIRCVGGNISVGIEADPNPFLSYSDPEAVTCSYFGVCTGWGANGTWVISPQDGPRLPTGGAGVCWVPATSGQVPPSSIQGGQDNGEPLYVARASHEGALIPGKLVSSHGCAYIPWGGAEHPKNEYEVLCDCNCSWVPTSGGNIPDGAIAGGQTEDGEPLFIGRINHNGSLTVGKVQQSHGVLYIPYGGEELGFPDYEILICH